MEKEHIVYEKSDIFWLKMTERDRLHHKFIARGKSTVSVKYIFI